MQLVLDADEIDEALAEYVKRNHPTLVADTSGASWEIDGDMPTSVTISVSTTTPDKAMVEV